MCKGNREQTEQVLEHSAARVPHQFLLSSRGTTEVSLPIPKRVLASPVDNLLKTPTQESLKTPTQESLKTPTHNILKEPTGNPLKDPVGNPMKYPTPEQNPLKEPGRDTEPKPYKNTIPLPLPKNFNSFEETPAMTNLKDYQQAFIAKLKPAADKVAQALNVPSSAVLAQLAYESGWGRSSLASKHNNYGGIKAGSSWKGAVAELPTKEKNQTETEVAKFRSYESPETYADDMIALLTKPRYQKVSGAKDPYQYALRLGLAGYHQDTPGVYADEIRRIAQQIDGGNV